MTLNTLTAEMTLSTLTAETTLNTLTVEMTLNTLSVEMTLNILTADMKFNTLTADMTLDTSTTFKTIRPKYVANSDDSHDFIHIHPSFLSQKSNVNLHPDHQRQHTVVSAQGKRRFHKVREVLTVN